MIFIPKFTSTAIAADFRRISCCNVIYKAISKLLKKGLKEVSPYLINESQGAFVKGRALLFNVLLC